MALNLEAAKDAEAYEALKQRVSGADKANYEARYDYAPADALLEPLAELPGDSQFIATYRPQPGPVAPFMTAKKLNEKHATAYLATLSLRQVILGAIDKQPLTYFIGPEALTEETLQEISDAIKLQRERVESKHLHLLCRQMVYSGTDLMQYDRIVILVRTKSGVIDENTPVEKVPEVQRAKSEAYWRKEATRRLDAALQDASRADKTTEAGYEDRIAEAMNSGNADEAQRLRSELEAERAKVAAEIQTERDEEAVRLEAQRTALSAARKGKQSAPPGWVLAVFDNMPERDEIRAGDVHYEGRALHIVSALPGEQILPETIAEAERAGLSISQEALRRVPRLLVGVCRQYYSATTVGAPPEFDGKEFPLFEQISLDSDDPRSLPLVLYYAGLLSRSHKTPMDEFRADPYDSIYDPANKDFHAKNYAALDRAVRLSLGFRRFRETAYDSLVEPYATTLDQQNAKPIARPRLVPLDYLARAASERNPAAARKLERAAEEFARLGQLPSADALSAAKASAVSVFKTPAEAPVRVEHTTGYDTALRPFMTALGGLFGQRWNNHYFHQTVGIGKLVADVGDSDSKPRELCNVFPLYALLPPPSMMLKKKVLAYLYRDRERLAAIGAYVRAHQQDVGSNDTARLVGDVWDAVSKYIAEVGRTEKPDAAVLEASVKRIREFVQETDLSEPTQGEPALEKELAARFLVQSEKFQALWDLVRDVQKSALERKAPLRHMTYAHQLESTLVEISAALAGETGGSEARTRTAGRLAVLLPMLLMTYPWMTRGNELVHDAINTATEIQRKTMRTVKYVWGPRNTGSIREVVERATPAGTANEFDAAIAYLAAQELEPIRKRFLEAKEKTPKDMAAFVTGFITDDSPNTATLTNIGRMALRSAPIVVRVLTLAEIARKGHVESAPVIYASAMPMQATGAQFGELQGAIEKNTLLLGEALYGRDPELRSIEARLASAKNDSARLAEANYDLDVYGQRQQSVRKLKNEALAEAAYVRSQRRGRIVNIYALTPALRYRYVCARQFALFTELFDLVQRDPDFWVDFAYSEKEVQNTHQTFGRLASLPLAQWNIKDMQEASELLVDAADRESGQPAMHQAHGIDRTLFDSPIVREVARRISASTKTARPNGLRGAEAAFLAFGRGYYLSVRSLIDILRELRDDVSLVEDDEHSVALVAIDDMLHETIRTLRDLDETPQQISPVQDYSNEAIVVQRNLNNLRFLLRDRYFYNVAPQNSAEPRRIAVARTPFDDAAYGAFGPKNAGVSIGFSDWGVSLEEFDPTESVACVVRRFAPDSNLGPTVQLQLYIDHSGFLAITETGNRLRNFLTAVFIEGGVTYGVKANLDTGVAYGWKGVGDGASHVVADVATELFTANQAAIAKQLADAVGAHHGASWSKSLAKQAYERLNKRKITEHPYSEEAARVLREVVAERVQMLEDLASMLHRSMPIARDANLYRASVLLVLTRRRPDGTVNVTTASVGDLAMVAMAYPLVTDTRNVSRTYDRIREIKVDELATADNYAQLVRRPSELKDPKQRTRAASDIAKLLDEMTTVSVPAAERDDPTKVAMYLERIGPNTADVFQVPYTFASFVGRLNGTMASYAAAEAIYSNEASEKAAVSNKLAAGATFSPEDARQQLLDEENRLKAIANDDERTKAARKLALDIALYDYLVEIGSGTPESVTIVARSNAADKTVAEPLRKLIDKNKELRTSSFKNVSQTLSENDDANLRAWVDQSIELRRNAGTVAFGDGDDDVQGNYIRQMLENERSHLEQAARGAGAELQASLSRFGISVPLVRRRDNRAEVPLFFHLAVVEQDYVPTRREQLQTVSLLAELIRSGSNALRTLKVTRTADGRSALADFSLTKEAAGDLLRASGKGAGWVVAYSSTAAVVASTEEQLRRMIELQQLMQRAFSIVSQRQMLPVVRALRNLGNTEDTLDTRFALPLPIATANTPRDGDRYREQVLVDKNSIAKAALLPLDLFWRPFALVDFDELSQRLERVRGKRDGVARLLEDYFARVNLVCGVERSPFAAGNLWLKRRECIATFEQIRAYADANGSGPLYAEYLAGRYVSEDARLLPIVSAEPSDLVRVSSYDLTTADRAYFVVSGNFTRFVSSGLFAETARRAAHRLEVHLALSALAGLAKDRIAQLRNKRDLASSDQLAAALSSRLAADEVLIAAGSNDPAAYVKQYDRRAFGTDNPAEFAKQMLGTMQVHFRAQLDGLVRVALRSDAAIDGSKAMVPIDPTKIDAAVTSPVNSEFGLMYFGPMAPAAAKDLDEGRKELAAVLASDKLFDPEMRYAPRNEGQTKNSSSRMIVARSRFLVHAS